MDGQRPRNVHVMPVLYHSSILIKGMPAVLANGKRRGAKRRGNLGFRRTFAPELQIASLRSQ